MVKRSPRKTKEEQRSFNMSRIQSKDTKPEIILRKTLWHAGIRYRKNFNTLPGKPDIVITKHKIAIFCDGEFWHGKDWDIKKPKIQANRAYWIEKIERNMARDKEIDKQMQCEGWIVLRFWSKDIQKNLGLCVDEIKYAILKAKVNLCNSDYKDGC
ncbi:MAG: very short patch repair endonuclease [Eubacteriales bacterium]|jgi:DNA mismatch endonuclease (patch repair protein)